jgi:hypothetical protein
MNELDRIIIDIMRYTKLKKSIEGAFQDQEL